MTKNEQIKILRGMVDGNDDNDTYAAYLTLAGDAILAKAFPFDNTKKVVPERYEMKQVEIAAYLMNKRGAEGQLSHSENGISRSYESGDIPDSMLKSVTPYCGVVS